jgi:hypothetical protein
MVGTPPEGAWRSTQAGRSTTVRPVSGVRPFSTSCVAAVLVGALAAAPAPAKPGHAGGTRIDWPLKQATTTVAPGTTLTVTVRRTGKAARSAPVTVALVRITQKGKAMRRVATRRAREGKLSVRVPKGDGRLYELRLTLGHLHQVGRVRTPAAPAPVTPAPPAPSPAPTPTPPASPWADCPAGGTSAAELRLDAPGVPVHPGDRVATTFADTGVSCLATGYGGRWERRADDGSWVEVPSYEPVPAIAIILKPGGVFASTVRVPVDATPGHYRLGKSATVEPSPGIDPATGHAPYVWAYAELDVVA